MVWVVALGPGFTQRLMPALKPNYPSNTLGSSPLLCRSSFHTFLGLILIPLFSSVPMSCFTKELEYQKRLTVEVNFGSKSALSSYCFSESASAVGEAERVGTSELHHPGAPLPFRSMGVEGSWGRQTACPTPGLRMLGLQTLGPKKGTKAGILKGGRPRDGQKSLEPGVLLLLFLTSHVCLVLFMLLALIFALLSQILELKETPARTHLSLNSVPQSTLQEPRMGIFHWVTHMTSCYLETGKINRAPIQCYYS